MTWSGDISRMGQLAANVGRLAQVPSRASKRAAVEIRALIEEEFDAEADPYGNAWKPHAPATVERWGEHPILRLSGDMRASLHVAPRRGAGVSVSIDHPSEDHQTGWSGPQGAGPARPILPSNRFPARWKEAIEVAVNETIREVTG